MIQSLLEEYQLAQERVNHLRNEIQNHSDGYLYITCTRCYGSLSYRDHSNGFIVQELCDEYYGDNGIVDVYTNNPDHGIITNGDVTVMSLDEIHNMSRGNISMFRAVTNWIAR